ncbi:MAG TPA: TlpA disulfide reductase family protein [Fibrobacteria bacterium]|nr:TlpA disulfide reductase family protein [Fibrobacteria bacterium]
MGFKGSRKWVGRILIAFFAVACLIFVRSAWKRDVPAVVQVYRWMHDTTRIDFDLPLESIDGSNRTFSEFKQKRILLFYFSPTCGHCQKAFSRIKMYRDKYQGDSLSVVAVVTGKASTEDVVAFRSDFQLDMPTFRDKSRQFSKLYNSGSVPLMLLVSRDGTFEAWNSADSSTLDSVENAIRKSIGSP